MDFKNLCQKIDVDSIKAKMPTMPAMPAMPPIKLPKSIPKLKSRKIFKSSREDVRKASPKQQTAGLQPPPHPISSADFINRTPTRISTISSLMNQGLERNRSTYRSAGSIDDDYASPTHYDRRGSRPLSPISSPINGVDTPGMVTGSSNNVKMSLTEKLQKGYKDFSDFRFKHIFAKKTVVRRDNIEVDHYVQRYNEDRLREEQEQERRDRELADNYRFKFKLSRQNTGHTNSITSNESPVAEPRAQAQARNVGKSVGELSGDESGMEVTPPKRKPGIAATRFAKMRNPPLRRSMSEDSNDETAEEISKPEFNPRTLKSITETHTPAEEVSPMTAPTNVATGKNKGYKERLRNIKDYVSSHDESGTESPAVENTSGGAKVMSKLRGLGKRNEEKTASDGERKRKPITPQQSDERDDSKSMADSSLSAIKQNFKRIQKSLKRPPPATTADTDDDDDGHTTQVPKPPSRTEKLTARLRRFKSGDVSNVDNENTTPQRDEEANKSPVHAVFTNKLQTWKKSFKKKPNETKSEEETSPEAQKRTGTLMNKLKYIRSRKNPNSNDELEDNEEDVAVTNTKESTRKPSNLEEKFEQARQKTLKKVNEKMQQMKFFHKSQEHVEKGMPPKRYSSHEDDDEEDRRAVANVPPTISRRSINDSYQYHNENDDIEEITNIQQEYNAQRTRAVWTTKPILPESMESDNDAEFPRVLIHQDNSDVFESTLIIAVTRPAPPSPTPRISEILPDEPSPKSVEWISNKEIITSFMQVTPPHKKHLVVEATIATETRGHARRLSIDSNSDSDTWIPEQLRNKQLSHSKESSRRASTAGLNSIVENEEPWKVHSMYQKEKLYKTKSIDIFEKNAVQGAAFEDFDDELRNEPVVRIVNNNVDSFEHDSSEEPDAADDDNSSRVTKISVEALRVENSQKNTILMELKPPTHLNENQLRQIGNSRESLVANFGDNEEIEDSDDDEDDRPPSAAPSPPPSFSPPPPPLPQRKQSTLITKPTEAPPPLPVTKMPLDVRDAPPKIPERTASMTRIAKPLVKTSSLRLAYNEQVKPADVGKVNKLISRFEKPPTKVQQRPRIVPRRDLQEFSDDESDEEEDDDDLDNNAEDSDVGSDEDQINANIKVQRELTATPTNTLKTDVVDLVNSAVIAKVMPLKRTAPVPDLVVRKHEIIVPTLVMPEEEKLDIKPQKSASVVRTASLGLDSNCNYSRPSSEYGSPLAYPSSLIGSKETTPIQDRRQQEIRNAGRSRRSMTRDNEHFYSFDSDEENSYYSISPSGSSRYIVEI